MLTGTVTSSVSPRQYEGEQTEVDGVLIVPDMTKYHKDSAIKFTKERTVYLKAQHNVYTYYVTYIAYWEHNAVRHCRRASTVFSISLARQLVKLTGRNECKSITGFPGFSNGIIFAKF